MFALKEEKIQKAMFYWNPKATKCKYKKKVTKIIKTSKTKVVVGANLSIGKKD